MKKIQLSVLALFTCTNFAMAGGDILPITPYVMEVETTPISVVPTPVVTAPIVPAPTAPVIVPASNISPIYVGLGLVAARYDSRCLSSVTSCDGVDKSGGLLVRAGYDFNEYMGMEARALFTAYKDSKSKIKHYGAFVKPMYPLTDGLNAYGLVGFAKNTTSGTLRKIDVSGLAFGAGLEYDLSDDKKKDAKYDREFDGIADQEKGFGVFADYEKLYYKSGAPKLDAVSVGITYDF
jgi:OOP family OmpA-OmpF porin